MALRVGAAHWQVARACTCYVLAMLTRRQVAARLGKSVATVRRIEGVLLEPVRDRRGTYRFDEDAVARLVHDVAHGRVRLCEEFRDHFESSRLLGGVHCARHRGQMEPSSEVLQELRARIDAADERERMLRCENEELRETVARLETLLFAI